MITAPNDSIFQAFNPLQALARQRGGLFPWVAVLFGTGVGGYFLLPVEPGPAEYLIFGLGAGALLLAIRMLPDLYAPLASGVFLLLSGAMVAGGHARYESAPVLAFRYYGPVEGRVVTVDRSFSNKLRITLDQVVLENMPPVRTPARVRVSLHAQADPEQNGLPLPSPGQHLILTANLSPPPGPAEPGGFDFRRYAWFRNLGGVGYSRTPVLRIGPDRISGLWVRINVLRAALSGFVRRQITGAAGGFAAAITSGDRSAISPDTLATLRASNLAHLLAISGLHMGLLTGFIFAAIRYGMALVPGLALHWPLKKIAAVAAMAVGAGYLTLSGGNVATMRAFIMVMVMFVAILAGRRALTLNAVALAALIVLLIEPEALVGPGFQMSFAATTALIFIFGTLRRPREARMPRWLRRVLAVVLSSLVAGLATAPIGAAHFNQVAQYGLLANVLSVPVMGLIVVPAGVLGFLLTPLGLGGIGFWVMGLGIRWILAVAHWVAGLDGAVWKVVTPDAAVLPLICFGGLVVILWQGRARFTGIALMAVGTALWMQTERPVLLISDSGRLIGFLTSEGRALSKPRGDGFVARSWLENDGDKALQAEAAGRLGLHHQDGVFSAKISGREVFLLTGRGAAAKFASLCTGGHWLIFAGERPDTPGDCRLFGTDELRETGALALFEGTAGPKIITVAQRAGRRIWVRGR